MDSERDRERDKRDTTELRRKQAARETEEERLADDAERDEETKQHERRRDKASYLKQKLAERERAEREAE